ncbi:low temperature requirement protein A [Mumia sp. DW29H23]|uniref:low temperature requirement protein A n=1 Tax=Mumia sp. DW29H23 TaxID=3421241 RepID=UPI003D694316
MVGHGKVHAPPLRTRPPVATVAGDRVTMFEIFFDLVFVFAISQVVTFVDHAASPLRFVDGLVLLLLLWWAWSAFAWLGNQVRVDRGYLRVGMLVAMAGLFLAAVVMPDAWSAGAGAQRSSLVLALVFTGVRLTYAIMGIASAGGRRLRTQLTIDLIPQSVSGVLLVVGGALGGASQTVLWATAFVVDFAGGRIASRYRGWSLRSLEHFVERHGLVLIIVLGEPLVTTGVEAGPYDPLLPLLTRSFLVFVAAVALWSLYFHDLAPRAARALAASGPSRSSLARDAYTFVHFPLVVGVVALALGTKQLLQEPATPPESAAVALCGGAALFLAALELFRWVVLRTWRRSSAVLVLVLGAVLGLARDCPTVVVMVLVVAVLVTAALVDLGRARRPSGP